MKNLIFFTCCWLLIGCKKNDQSRITQKILIAETDPAMFGMKQFNSEKRNAGYLLRNPNSNKCDNFIKPSKKNSTIFLDFDGATVSGTSWNWISDIFAAPANLTDDEQCFIYNRFVQAYDTFNVLITLDSLKYFATNPANRVKIIFTETDNWFCGLSHCAGGVAYVGSFTWGDNTPCFVFTTALAYNQHYIAEAGVHEAGHTLGLYHQSVYDTACVKTAEYKQGKIMGVSYNFPYGTWCIGTSSTSCTKIQDDIQTIALIIGYN